MQVKLLPENDVLTDLGKEEAKLLGKHWKNVIFTKVFVSTLCRTQETACIILDNSNTTDKPEMIIDARIRERVADHFLLFYELNFFLVYI